MPQKGYIMKCAIVELGAVSRRTRDYSGNFGWDNLTFSFKRVPPNW